MKEKFRVEFLDEAADFINRLDEKPREKVLYNVWKARLTNDKELFKKLSGEIWEFRTLYSKNYYRLFAFWDKSDKEDTVVVSTHGIIKKSGKTPPKEIDKAERIRQLYFKQKGK